ncbi:MAG: phytanoyl-CoA dioxygenase family protein [Acidobacteriota bacterium]
MKTNLSQKQITFYQEEGYLPIEGFLDDDELARWRNAAEAAVERRLASLRQRTASGELKTPLMARLRSSLESVVGQKGAYALRQAARKVLGPKLMPVGLSSVLDTNQGDQGSFYANVYTQVIGSSRENEELRGCVFDPQLGSVVAQLSAMIGVRIYHDQALFKMPRSNFTSWHLDTPYWSFHSPQALTMWLALDDMTPENGCMRYLPGSHHTARMDKNLSIGSDFDGIFKYYPEWKKIEPVLCPCRAGTAVFHNGLVAHAAGPNLGDRPRRAYAIAFMPEQATFNGIKDVMSSEYFKMLKVGDPLANEEVYPLIWPARPGSHESMNNSQDERS